MTFKKLSILPTYNQQDISQRELLKKAKFGCQKIIFDKMSLVSKLYQKKAFAKSERGQKEGSSEIVDHNFRKKNSQVKPGCF